MSLLNQMEVFYTVANLNSFSQAAIKLGLSKGYVSMQVNELEKTLKVKLLNRTTRHLSLTEAGTLLLASCEKIMREQKEVLTLAESLQAKPAGRLRVSAAPSIAATIFSHLIPDYIKHYPNVTVEVDASSSKLDLSKNNIDIALRITRSPDERYVARLLTTFNMVVCASPNYLKNTDPIKQPNDLLRHNCLIYGADPEGEHWSFTKNNETQEINVKGNLTANNINLILQGALSGLGVVQIPDYVLREKQHKGSLIPLLTEYTQTSMPLYAIYPSMIFGSPKIESFLGHLKKYFNKS